MIDSSTALATALQQKIDFKTKPVGALGMLEAIALRAGVIQETLTPEVNQPHIVVFAADHGIAATGLVNPYPQAVTAQMVLNFMQGGAAINVFCRQHGIRLLVVDSGVNHVFTGVAGTPGFIDAKVGAGSGNYLEGPAMTREEAVLAIEKGRSVISGIHAEGCNTVGLGEMGIGNTSSAALIMSNLLQIPVRECAGKGTGANDAQMAVKTATLEKAAARHDLGTPVAAIELLQKVGGFEIAMMAGAYLQAAALKMIIVVDGFIATAALLIAREIENSVLNYCIFAHASNEQGHKRLLAHLGAQPLLQLGMRLGEGTGAALAIPLIQSAVCFLNEMASFDTAGVSNKV